MFDLFNKNFTELRYEKYGLIGDTGVSKLNPPSILMGLRLKGNMRVSINGNGEETVTSTIQYRVGEYVPPNSKINGRLVTECVPINALGIDTGYIVYVK